MKKNNIWFIGGLSGGHIYPLISLYKTEYNKYLENIDYIFFIPKNELIEKIFNSQKELLIKKNIINYPKPTKNTFKNIIFFFYSIIIFLKIFYMFIINKPKIIYSSGGYFSLPFWICSIIFKTPFLLYHLDAIPGKAGKLMGQLHSKQYIVHLDTKKYISNKNEVILTKYPIRYQLKDKIDKIEAKKIANINKNIYVIFILGGSQGSEEINDFISSALFMLKNKQIYIFHQTGKIQKEYMQNIYKINNINSYVFDFCNDLVLYYNAADLIISRAGAGTLAEIYFFKKPALIIPLKNIAGDHQTHNAKLYNKKNNEIKIINNKYYLIIQLKFLLNKNAKS
jgi:UDP-N-acetylglucosamine--N-acetylmuramyl-(pentapeptide) pyrophosphoryl-undecaprenol N-acetylglucosamine transferase